MCGLVNWRMNCVHLAQVTIVASHCPSIVSRDNQGPISGIGPANTVSPQEPEKVDLGSGGSSSGISNQEDWVNFLDHSSWVNLSGWETAGSIVTSACILAMSGLFEELPIWGAL